MDYLISGDILVGEWYIIFWRDPQSGELEKSIFEPMQFLGIDDRGYHFKEDRGQWFNNHTFRGALNLRFVPLAEPHLAPLPDMQEMLAKIEAVDAASRQTALDHASDRAEYAALLTLDCPPAMPLLIATEQPATLTQVLPQARPNALANTGQLNAIATWIARHAPHAEKNWFIRFTQSLFGHSVAMNLLTSAQASQVELALAQISRTQAYPPEWNTADGLLNMHYKVDLYPTDYERAKVTYRACVQAFCYEVSLGRTNHPKHLTHGEAGAFSELVKSAISTVAIH